ncbi:MAG: CTP-dependent riboflavin kinase [Candidatus Bathyarchaeota archaeon]|nr:CTP-dependent riboflavin kinase [Candidatus Bathyarchaeota archaeon]
MEESQSKDQELKNAALQGTVFGGKGVGREFIGFAWVRRQIIEKVGFSPYHGTLNILLSRAEAKHLKLILKKVKRIEITPERGFYRGWCVKVRLMNEIEAAIIIPEKTDYPSNVLEIIAPISLRQAFSLKDGDVFKVIVLLDN